MWKTILSILGATGELKVDQFHDVFLDVINHFMLYGLFDIGQSSNRLCTTLFLRKFDDYTVDNLDTTD